MIILSIFKMVFYCLLSITQRKKQYNNIKAIKIISQGPILNLCFGGFEIFRTEIIYTSNLNLYIFYILSDTN